MAKNDERQSGAIHLRRAYSDRGPCTGRGIHRMCRDWHGRRDAQSYYNGLSSGDLNHL